jgi:DNA-binding NarL/FixJ family response regulator
MSKSATVECEKGKYELVIRVPIQIAFVEGAIVVDEPQLAGLRLTPRETLVLEQVCKSKVNKEIADSLNISERAIKFHVSSLLKKAGLHSRADLIRRYGRRAEAQ